MDSRVQGDGQFLWPGALVTDSNENLYLTDQADNKIVVFDKDGGSVAKWGETGSGQGQLLGPSGLAFDSNENLFVSDTRNHRVQVFTKDGQFLSSFGSKGSGDGQFNMPWGIAIDSKDDVYVADWGNSRVQKLSAHGTLLQTIGEPGNGKGQLDHPSDVSVRQGRGHLRGRLGQQPRHNLPARWHIPGHTNWGRHQPVGRAKSKVAANPDLAKARARADLEPEWRLWHPAAILVDDEYNILIAEAQHMRVQIYEKDPNYFEGRSSRSSLE